jgi:serine protease
MRFLTPALYFLAAAASQAAHVSAVPNLFEDGGGDGGTSRVFIRYKPGHKEEVKDEVATSLGLGNGGRALGTASADNEAFHYEFNKLSTIAVTVPTDELENLRKDPNILLIEEDHRRSLIGIAESSSDNPGGLRSRRDQTTSQTVPYGIDMVEARDVWDANRDGIVDDGAPTGATRKVCIIDSGFLVTHPDLQGISVAGYNGNLPWNQDGNGHGTHVAGTIAAMNNNIGVVGVSPGTVQLYIVRVFGDAGSWAYSSDLIDAANRCASAGANIISMSLGGPSFSATEDAKFSELNNQGILSIAAAGNSGGTDLGYPASYPSVMSVAAIDSNKLLASFSTRNSQVDISAPGKDVLSTTPTAGYSSWSGTSMATPHVSAVAALVWSAKTSATNAEVRAALIASAEDLGTPGRDDSYGHGLVKAKQAIEFLLGLSTSRPTSAPPPTSAPSARPPCVGADVEVKILTDRYPGETTWTLGGTGTAMSGGPYSLQNTLYSVKQCFTSGQYGQYTFSIKDSYGDGICCVYGSGSYNVLVNGNTAFSGGQFASSEDKTVVIGTTPIPQSSLPTTVEPTAKPTHVRTLIPYVVCYCYPLSHLLIHSVFRSEKTPSSTRPSTAMPTSAKPTSVSNFSSVVFCFFPIHYLT